MHATHAISTRTESGRVTRRGRGRMNVMRGNPPVYRRGGEVPVTTI